jgi:hypothetical protein
MSSVLWVAAAAILNWDLSSTSGWVVVSGALYPLGVFAPAIAALVLTAQAGREPAVMSLLRRTLKWSVDGRWYVFAVGYFAAVKMGVAIVHRVITSHWPAFSQTPWFVMPIAILVSTPAQAGEEIGWRGYVTRGVAHNRDPLARRDMLPDHDAFSELNVQGSGLKP